MPENISSSPHPAMTLEDHIVEIAADRLVAKVMSEVARLVARGWSRDEALLQVHFSPDWPLASEEKLVPGVIPDLIANGRAR